MSVVEFFREACKPPSTVPAWQWCEENIRLDESSFLRGPYRTDLMPFVRAWYDFAQDPRTRRFVILVSAQSSKTQNAMNMLCYYACEDPGPTMWVMASMDNAKEFKKKRLNNLFEQCCPPVAKLLPCEIENNTRALVKFPGGVLLMRGSESRIGLQSDPMRRLICDERREWKPGAINMVRERMKTFSNCTEISMGTAGYEHDQLHADFLHGSQTFVHWYCPHCQHSQPFRFGREASTLFPESRDRGGIVFDLDGAKKPDGEIDETHIRETTRYECENCGAHFRNIDKAKLIDSWHLHHRNPTALPKYPSMHWNELYMPWEMSGWGELAVKFLRAKKSMDQGNPEPLKTFVTESLGEPWRDETEATEESDLLDRMGEYMLGEEWEQESVKVITVDVQKDTTYLVYIMRQLTKGMESRLVDCGKLPGFAELRDYQLQHGVKDRCVWLDYSHKPQDVAEACFMYGWGTLIGSDHAEFSRMVWNPEKKINESIKSYFKPNHVDPGIGTRRQGGRKLKRYTWSKPHYKDMLYLYSIRGKPPLWEIPKNVPRDYLKEVQSNERRRIPQTDGSVVEEWHERGRHDYADCELMFRVVMDLAAEP